MKGPPWRAWVPTERNLTRLKQLPWPAVPVTQLNAVCCKKAKGQDPREGLPVLLEAQRCTGNHQRLQLEIQKRKTRPLLLLSPSPDSFPPVSRKQQLPSGFLSAGSRGSGQHHGQPRPDCTSAVCGCEGSQAHEDSNLYKVLADSRAAKCTGRHRDSSQSILLSLLTSQQPRQAQGSMPMATSKPSPGYEVQPTRALGGTAALDPPLPQPSYLEL